LEGKLLGICTLLKKGFDNFKLEEFQEITSETVKNIFSKQFGFYLSLGFSELKKYYRPNILKEANKLSNLFVK
jgi:hypothetical protein